jgi:hypothetical protein
VTVPRAARRAALIAVALVSGAGVAARAKPHAKADDRCGNGGPAPGPGSLDPFRLPAPRALELNADGKAPYRQGKWEEARARYRAALAADPEFLAPKLNVACSFVRQERFAEATAEVVGLLDRAYVPWAREILDATDLGALKARPEWKEIERAMAASASRWGEGLEASLLFVARVRPPLRVPDGPGVFILNPHQEVWAYAPGTQRYRQVTTEGGHVVALAVSSEHSRIAYVTAEKLVRGERPGDVALRDVTLHELTLATMTHGPTARVEGDVRRVAIGVAVGGFQRSFFFDIQGNKTRGLHHIEATGDLAPVALLPAGRTNPVVVTVLTGGGAKAIHSLNLGPGCEWLTGNGKGEGGLPTVGLARTELKSGYGAGLAGLPIP